MSRIRNTLFLTVDIDTISNVEKVAVVVPVTSAKAKVAGSNAMLAQSFSTVVLKCLMVSSRAHGDQFLEHVCLKLHQLFGAVQYL